MTTPGKGDPPTLTTPAIRGLSLVQATAEASELFSLSTAFGLFAWASVWALTTK
jgi:hypothetical protein